jgi:hypothetical protein
MKSLSVIRSPTQSPGRLSWAPPFVLGLAIGMKYVLRRLPSAISLVIPSSSNRKCRVGSANGEFRIGFSIETGGTGPLQSSGEVAHLAGYAARASA